MLTPLQQIIEERARQKMRSDLKSLVDFLSTNRLAKYLQVKTENGLVPLVAHYTQNPLFETGIDNDMKLANKLMNFNEAKSLLIQFYIEEESRLLLERVDSIADYLVQRQEEV